MTNQNNAAQAHEAGQCICPPSDEHGPLCHKDCPVHGLSKLRAPVADERADDILTQVYDRFGIGVLVCNPSTLMACLGNVIRRANCLSQVEQVLSVPTPPEPEDDGVWGEESLLRWGADEKGYAEHFKTALAEWWRRTAGLTLASAPVADERTACPTDVCQAGRADGVLCANDECDRASGVRPASAPVAVEHPDGLRTLLAEFPGMRDDPKKGDAVFRCGVNGALDVVADRIRELLRSAPVAGEAQPEIEQMAVNRYRPVPDGKFSYKVVAGDGSRSLYTGTKDSCLRVAAKLTEAFLDGAFVASDASPQSSKDGEHGE